VRPAKTKIKRFKLETKYPHHRSEGLTRRRNRGTKTLVIDRPEEAADERETRQTPGGRPDTPDVGPADGRSRR
jgi:hypothetical protein